MVGRAAYSQGLQCRVDMGPTPAQLQTQNGQDSLILPDQLKCHLPALARSCYLLLGGRGEVGSQPSVHISAMALLHCIVTEEFLFLSLRADGELLEAKDMSHSFSFPSFLVIMV